LTYSDLLQQENINSQYLLVMSPRRYVASWSLFAGSVYSASFDYGYVNAVKSDDTVLTAGSSTSLSANQWYYDFDNETLYVHLGGTDPATTDMVATYELHFGTFDAYWYRIPDDNTSATVYYDPLIVSSPRVRARTTESNFGYIQSQSDNLILSNVTQVLDRHLNDSSFNDADIKIWHYLDQLKLANLKLVLNGICADYTYSERQVSFRLLDRVDVFKQSFRHPSPSASFYANSLADVANLDARYESKPIRKVYGVVDGYIPVFTNLAAASSLGREFALVGGVQNSADWLKSHIIANVPASPASTTSRTYVDSANGFRVGDQVWINSSAGSGSDEYPTVTAVNKTGSHYIDHTTTTVLAASASTVERSFLGNFYFVQNAVRYQPLWPRDYFANWWYLATSDIGAMLFDPSMTGTVGASALTTSDTLYCRIYSPVVSSGLVGESVSTETGNLTNGISILYDVIKNQLGITNLDDGAGGTWRTLVASVTDELGFAIPGKAADSWDSYREIIASILQSLLLKLYIDGNDNWAIAQVGPIGSATKTIGDDEILKDSYRQTFDYNELISDAIVEYAFREVSEQNSATGQSLTERALSQVARRLHNIERQKTFKSQHFLAIEAQKLADRLSYIYGDRLSIAKFRTKNRFFDAKINDVITVEKGRLPGAVASADFATVSTDKSLREVLIEIDDQKGIEDNSGSW